MNPHRLESTSKHKPAFSRVGENLWRLESSGVYYAFLKRKGNQFRRSLKTDDRTLAKRRLADLLKDFDGLLSYDARSLTFKTVSERWLESVSHTIKESTAKRRRTCLKALAPFFRGLTLRNITTTHCDRWKTKRGNSIAAQTFAHELDTMKAVLNYAKEQGLILRNPAQYIKRKRIVPAQIVVPTLAQFQELVAAIRHSDGRSTSQASAKDGADLVELLAYSGMRVEEARQLRWEHVAFKAQSITVTGGELRTKNYEVRPVPMTDSLFGLLSRLHREQKPKTNQFVVKIKSARKCLATACRKLEFPAFTHHDFRHFFATTCIEMGVDIPTVAAWLGHKDGGALLMKTYAHLRQPHSFAQIKRVSFEPAANVVPMNQPGTVTATTLPVASNTDASSVAVSTVAG